MHPLHTARFLESNVDADLPSDSAIRGEPIPESTLLANAKTIYVAELSYYVTQICLKLSILAFYWRLFNVSSMRIPIYLTTGFVVAWFIASVNLSFSFFLFGPRTRIHQSCWS
jgi:hypothetical protein